MVSKNALLDCPFCNKKTIDAFRAPSHVEGKKSSISSGSRTTYHRVAERVVIVSDCHNCGAKQKDVQDWYDGKYKKKLTHEERIEMLKKRGLPLVLDSKT